MDREMRVVQRWYRVLLVLGGAAVLFTGVAEWSTPLRYNPMAPRWIICAVAFGLAVLPSFSTITDQAYRRLVWLWGMGVLSWFLFVAWVHGLMIEDVLGLLPLATVAALLSSSRRDVAALVGLIASAFVVYSTLPDPAFPLGIAGIILLAQPFIVATLTLSRHDLHQEVLRSRSTLEQRVAARTQELQESLERLTKEMAVREEAERAAEAASRAKSTFLATMSHELRTPLTAILGYADIIAEDLDDAGLRESQEDLRRVEHAATHLLGLIDQMLDLSRIEAGAMEATAARVHVQSAVDGAVALTNESAANGNALHLEVADDLFVEADPLRLRQILVNLLDNAQKFTRQGQIRIEAMRGDTGVRIAVSDTGDGIPEHARSTIFDRFAQADGSSTRTHGGAGLGLTISAELVALMGGRIEVDSDIGVGSTFTLYLPAA